MRMSERLGPRILVGILTLGAAMWSAQTVRAQGGSQDADPADLRITLPPITVTAQKQPENVQDAPVSVTAVTGSELEDAAVRTVSDAAERAPNVMFTEFSARKLSAPRFRGIGASPSNPGVVTLIDGVPQLHANSSSIELLDIEDIEFVRGPQSPLFGRNAIGGLINIRSSRPSLDRWTGTISAPLGNFSTADVRGTASGPLVQDRLALGLSFGYSGRDGFTTNDATGHDLDSREAFFAKGNLYWVPAAHWEARVIMTGERARDGDYALNDLDALRARPRHAARDFEGFANRDVLAPTVLLHRAGTRVDVSTVTGLVWWKTDDHTDLDYTPLPLATRQNAEQDRQFTQDVWFSSAPDAPLRLSNRLAFRWQAGVSVFTQDYEQDALNQYAPYVLSPFVPFAVSQRSPQSALDDRGVGLYGQGTLTIHDRLDATVGVRGDHERKHATLESSYLPAIAPAAVVRAEEAFSDVSPEFTLAYHLTPAQRLVYVTAARGFKAGGFNAASPADAESYGQEHSWNYEAGLKAQFFAQRLQVNAAVFHVDWRDLQVNLPNPAVPGQFYIANAAGATSNGAEVEVRARLLAGCDFFSSVGYTSARFSDGSLSSGVPVGGNRLPNTPRYTADLGGQYSVPLSAERAVYGRADVVFRGQYEYDDANTAGQDAYSLTNFRAGWRQRQFYIEAWVRNAFATEYIPVALAYPGLAPSGFLGESGAPRTFGLRTGVSF